MVTGVRRTDVYNQAFVVPDSLLWDVVHLEKNGRRQAYLTLPIWKQSRSLVSEKRMEEATDRPDIINNSYVTGLGTGDHRSTLVICERTYQYYHAYTPEDRVKNEITYYKKKQESRRAFLSPTLVSGSVYKAPSADTDKEIMREIWWDLMPNEQAYCETQGISPST